MSRRKGRTADCSSEDARNRLKRAEAFLTVAELVMGGSAWRTRRRGVRSSGRAAC